MASLRRFGGDAVGLGAAGIVLGTMLAALGTPLILALLIAALPLLTTLRFRVLLTLSIALFFLIAPLRGVGSRVVILDPLSAMRDWVLLPLVASVPGDAGALAAGLTLGDSDYFSQAFRSAMRASATTHLVALSGFNVTLMLGFARRLLRKRVNRKHEAYAGIALLGGFVLIAGFQPSLLRAALMGTALLIGGLVGKRIAPARLLLLIAATMLLIEPQFITHLGFILSFISSWALLAMFGDVETLLASGIPLRQLLAKAVAPTFFAQLGVAPTLLASVGSVALVGLLVNPLVIPLTPLLTALAGGQLLLAHAAPGLAALLSPLVSLSMLPVTFAIGLAAKVPLTVSFALPASVAALLYGASIIWSLKWRPKLW